MDVGSVVKLNPDVLIPGDEHLLNYFFIVQEVILTTPMVSYIKIVGVNNSWRLTMPSNAFIPYEAAQNKITEEDLRKDFG